MSELIDLVNSKGELVKRGVPRDDASHYDGLHMPIVIAVIFNSLGHVLVHERAKEKSHGGMIDHVCGGILSGETPVQAVLRESPEEVGVTPERVRVVREGVNEYNRYCYLLVGYCDTAPSAALNPKEVAWAAYHPIEELKEREKSRTFTFVRGFFEDIEHALKAQTNS